MHHFWGVGKQSGVFEATFWSPWPWYRRSSPWPWSLKFSKITLSSARGQLCFLELLKFCSLSENKFWRSFFWRENAWKNFWTPFFSENTWKIFLKTFFLRNTYACVLGPWPWPREDLSSEALSLALASDFFVCLALASSLVSSTPPLLVR